MTRILLIDGPPFISLKFFETIGKSTILGAKKLTGVSSKSSPAADTSTDDIEPLESLLSLSSPCNLNSTYRQSFVPDLAFMCQTREKQSVNGSIF